MFTPSTFAALRASSLRIFHSCNIRQMEEIEQIDKVLMIVIDISDSDNDLGSNGNIVGGCKSGGTCMHCQFLATLAKKNIADGSEFRRFISWLVQLNFRMSHFP